MKASDFLGSETTKTQASVFLNEPTAEPDTDRKGFWDGLTAESGTPMPFDRDGFKKENHSVPNVIGNRLRLMFVDPIRDGMKAGAKGVSGKPLTMKDVQDILGFQLDVGVGRVIAGGLMGRGRSGVVSSMGGVPAKVSQGISKSKMLKDIAFENYANKPSHAIKELKPGKNLTTRLKEAVKTPELDKFLNAQLAKIPKAIERVPGGKKLNEWFMYGYRGDLPDAKKFNKSYEKTKINQSLGVDYGIDLGRRLQSFDETDQLKLGQYIRGEVDELPDNLLDIGTEVKEILFHLGKQAVDVGILNEESFFKNAGKYMPRLYTSKEYSNLATKFNVTNPNKLDLSRVKGRKDIPKEVRKEMGEILTPGYPVAKGIAQLTHDIELGKFFKGIAKTEDWARPATRKRIFKKDGSTVNEIIEPEDIPEGWKQLGNSKKLGHLRDAYVHPEIAKEIDYVMRSQGDLEKTWNYALGKWKFGKVILSPKTHVRNVLSNSILAHLGGFPMWSQPKYINKSIRELKDGGAYWEAAKKTGLLDSTFVQRDLRNLYESIDSQLPGVKGNDLVQDVAGVGQIMTAIRKGAGKMGDAYQFEEQMFKLAKMMYNIDKRGMAPHKAAAEAEKWLFNYGKITRFQDRYKNHYLGSPFATFTFKSAPRIMEAAIKTPHRFAAPIAIVMGLEAAAQNYIGDTDEQIKSKKELRPDWMKKGVATFPRVPLVDEYGREHYLNLNYIMPWGDLTEGGIPGGVAPFSQPFLKEGYEQFMNRDSFYERPIADERNYAGLSKEQQLKEQIKARAGHAARTMLPTPFADAEKLIAAYKNEPDYQGRFRNPKVVAADAALGIKMYPVDYAEQMARQIFKKDPQKGILGKQIQRDIRQAYIKKKALSDRGIKTTEYDEIIQQKIEQLKGLAKEVTKTGEIYQKVK